ncbi:MAG: 50S ribosomal protein L25/general stress protein Ctc [Gammaproteobacteria bacterium]|nr:50S ribosomal protein L25/general stress protein Ctc [Gammaproteobacteria bacterium]
MSVSFEMNAELRSDMGKGASRRLRREADLVPAVVYGLGLPALSISVTHKDMFLNLEHEGFYSHVLTINVDGKTEKVILKDLQRHPYKPRILHADFLRVDENATIHKKVPLHFVNGDRAPGVKTGGGQIEKSITEVEIVCLPSQLPEFIEVNLIGMQLNDVLHLSDLKLSSAITIAELAKGHDLAVVSVHRSKAGTAEAAAAE